MGIAVKTERIEHHQADQRKREEDERGRRIQRGLLIAFGVSQVAAIALIYSSA
jgi:hypothetical protein